MGYENEVKERNANPVVTLNLHRSVAAAVAAYRDEFRNIIGSEPIVEKLLDNNTFVIATYGGGDYVQLGQFSLGQLPGCCGIAVFYHASVTSRFQKRGLGRLFLKIRQSAAILAGYTVGMATVLKSNKGERHILDQEGWVSQHEFKNKRTNNDVLLYTKDLT